MRRVAAFLFLVLTTAMPRIPSRCSVLAPQEGLRHTALRRDNASGLAPPLRLTRLAMLVAGASEALVGPESPDIKWAGTLRCDAVKGAVLRRVVAPEVSGIVADDKELDVFLGTKMLVMPKAGPSLSPKLYALALATAILLPLAAIGALLYRACIRTELVAAVILVTALVLTPAVVHGYIEWKARLLVDVPQAGKTTGTFSFQVLRMLAVGVPAWCAAYLLWKRLPYAAVVPIMGALIVSKSLVRSAVVPGEIVGVTQKPYESGSLSRQLMPVAVMALAVWLLIKLIYPSVSPNLSA